MKNTKHTLQRSTYMIYCFCKVYLSINLKSVKRGEQVKRFSKLRGLMVTANLTQETLAKSVGLSKTSINQKLSGKKPITLEDMKAIQKVLNDRLGMQLTIEELFIS